MSQGNVVVGGAGASAAGSKVQINHLSAGRVPGGAQVERSLPTPLLAGEHIVLGLNASMFKGYLRYIANRRAQQIGLETLFPNEENPFPWMSEMIDLKKERNFFETRVIEYQSGGALSWD